MIVVSGIRIPLGGNAGHAAEAACHTLYIKPEHVVNYKLRRVSYDARHGKVSQVCSVILTLRDPQAEQKLCETFAHVKPFAQYTLEPAPGTQPLRSRPVVVGFGPAGMFAAYVLSVYGYRPVVLERGGDVDSRAHAVKRFFQTGDLDTENNIQFGEGGAGTFSDGKLTTRINDAACDYILQVLTEHGAPENILYQAKPHIGSDRLREVVKNMRQTIINNGGEVLFHSRVHDMIIQDGTLRALQCADGERPAHVAVLACGHSARDTFEMLGRKPLALSPKPFAVGVRIEHLQKDIDRALYGRLSGDVRLPKGEYALSAKVNGNSVYTFCMCPGGTVVAAASEQGGVVTNGMSRYARAGDNANSALVAAVSFDDPFAGMEYQRRLERAAYAAGGADYKAPAQDVGNFLRGKPGLRITSVTPTFPRGVTTGDIEALLGQPIARQLRGGIGLFTRKLSGFDDPGAILTGLETRTSSPLRMERDTQTREAVGVAGLYPCGEGAGYAGGIMSAAVDGLKSAVAIIEKYKPD